MEGSPLPVLLGPRTWFLHVLYLIFNEGSAAYQLKAAIAVAGEFDAAMAGYREAAIRTTSIPEREYLVAQAARLSADRRT